MCAKMLLRELNDQERAELTNLTLQPGWKIICRMMEDMCQIATTRVIQLDPADANFVEKLRSFQNIARATNDCCDSLLKSIQAHSTIHLQQIDEEQEVDVLIAKVKKPEHQPQ